MCGALWEDRNKVNERSSIEDDVKDLSLEVIDTSLGCNG
jgi:hypothetical protein